MRQTKVPEGEKSIAAEAIDALVAAPLFAVELVVSILVCVISEIYVATFALTGVAVGFATESIPVGIASFMILYSLSRVLGTLANAVGASGQMVGGAIAQGLVQHGHAVRLATSPYPTPDEPDAPVT